MLGVAAGCPLRCSERGEFAVARTDGGEFRIDLDLDHAQREAERVRSMLAALRRRHDLTRYEYTKIIRIMPGGDTFAHPVLTLGNRFADNEDLLLSTYLHEQMHWYLWYLGTPERDMVAPFMDELVRRFPEAPTDLPDGLEVITERGRYRTKVLIGADGANSIVAQRLFPDRRLRRMPSLESEIGIGQRPPYPGEGKVLIDLGATERGYAWIFPKRERLSIGVAEFRGRPASPKVVFQRFVREEKGLAGFEVPPPSGHPLPLYCSRDASRSSSLVRHRALLVGDAGHLVDPLFGEGIYYAVRSGQMAAASVLANFHDHRHSLLDYELSVIREIYSEFRVASRVARIVYTFPRLCHRLMHRYQEVINLYYEVLQGRETYPTFFRKAKGVVKASFRELLRETLPFG